MSRGKGDLVVIGAGPAGLSAAIHAARSGRRVCVLEKNAAAGVKLLLTGGGRCNLTHGGAREEFLIHYGGEQKGRFVKPSLYGYDNRALQEFFMQHGLALTADDTGRIFPVTMKARDVLQVLLDVCATCGVEIRYRERVTWVERNCDGFAVLTAAGRYCAPCLVIATGGASYPHTGSTGDGYLFAQSLGHTVEPPAPALSPIVVRNFEFGNCAGISVSSSALSLLRNGKKIHEGVGDVLFTHKGLSGPGILDLSRYVAPGDHLTLSLVPAAALQGFADRLANDVVQCGGKPLRLCLKPYGIPIRLLERVAMIAGISLDQPCSALTRVIRRRIVECCTQQIFTVAHVEDFAVAMVTRGGVRINEVSPRNLQSRIVPGLFFAGEVLDIDGDTGGYNLQFAFSSGHCVGTGML